VRLVFLVKNQFHEKFMHLKINFYKKVLILLVKLNVPTKVYGNEKTFPSTKMRLPMFFERTFVFSSLFCVVSRYEQNSTTYI